jgi:uncharacterized membrane protein YjjB (DUF3815 family)
VKLNKKQLIAIAEHYVYAAIAAVGAAIIAGASTPRDLLIAALAGAFGPIIAALNPNEVKFGLGYAPPAVKPILEEVVKASKPKK